MNILEVVKKDIPNFVFEEAKKYKLVYPVKNSINAQPGDIVFLQNVQFHSELRGAFGIYVKKHSNYHLIDYVLSNGKFGVRQVHEDDALLDIQLCERQTQKAYESIDHLFMDKVKDLFIKNMPLIKCPKCNKFAFSLDDTEKFLKCNCGFIASFSSTIVRIENEIISRINNATN